MSKICQIYAKNIPMICQGYAQDTPKIGPVYCQNMPMICPRYAYGKRAGCKSKVDPLVAISTTRQNLRSQIYIPVPFYQSCPWKGNRPVAELRLREEYSTSPYALFYCHKLRTLDTDTAFFPTSEIGKGS